METKLAVYGLIGYPLGHSFSRAFFSELFATDGSGRRYENFELPVCDADSLHKLLTQNPDLQGFNVTAPHKQAIVPFVTLHGVAASVGACNTVKVRRTGNEISLEGYNTDVEGFSAAIGSMLGKEHSKALVLGTGGAAAAATAALTRMGIGCRRVSRSESRGDVTYSTLERDGLGGATVIVNATPAGTWPDVDECAPFPYKLIDSRCVCFDMVYNPAETLFMKRCAAHGARTSNGLEMLRRQALASLYIWECD